MKVALVHDHLNQFGGAEKVLGVLHAMWPNAPIFTLQYRPEPFGDLFKDADIRTSFIDRAPGAKKRFRWYLPLMPTATESYDLSEFDVVISSSSAFANGVITKPHTLHVCYCHTPTRYLWSDTTEYVSELRAPRFIKRLLPPILTRLRVWDRLAADRVDAFVANSMTVRERIERYYKHDSTVIHPPIDTDRFSISDEEKTYYLVGGRLVAYKRFDIVVKAFTKIGLPLKVFGTGPVEEDLKRMAGDNIEFLGRVSDEEQAKLYQNAIAFLNPQVEDFGITPIESMASGRPVIAYRRGGVLESVKEGVSGTFFDIQDWERVADTILRFDHTQFNPQTIREHAKRYDTESFKTQFKTFVENKYREHQANRLHAQDV